MQKFKIIQGGLTSKVIKPDTINKVKYVLEYGDKQIVETIQYFIEKCFENTKDRYEIKL